MASHFFCRSFSEPETIGFPYPCKFFTSGYSNSSVNTRLDQGWSCPVLLALLLLSCIVVDLHVCKLHLSMYIYIICIYIYTYTSYIYIVYVCIYTHIHHDNLADRYT